MASSGRAKKEVTERVHNKGGCFKKVKALAQKIGEEFGFGKPTADVKAIRILTINLHKADIVVEVFVKNPNPVPILLIKINYLVTSDGRKLLSGVITDLGTIHAHGSETVKIPLTLIYDDIQRTYNDIKAGSVIPYKVKVEHIVDVPVFGRISVPIEETGEIPMPRRPDIGLVKIKFGKLSFEESVAILHLKFVNTNGFDLGITSLDYEVWIADVSIGGAAVEKSVKIEKRGIGYVDLPVTFRPKDFGSALWDTITGRGSGYAVKGSVHVDTPFGAMKLLFNLDKLL